MTVPDATLLRHEHLFADAPFAAVIEADAPGTDLAAFWAERREAIERLAETYPAILFRGFADHGDAGFRAVREIAVEAPARYLYRSTPRTDVGNGVMTATEYPADQEIPPHCENAYQRDWPLRLLFGCIVAPARGGQTPLVDMRAVTAALDAETVRAFARRGVRYVRHYHAGFDLDWRVVFQTDDRAEVARYCREHSIAATWRADGTLRTEQTCQGTAHHPRTGETLWFNQAHLFHPSALGPEMMADMIDIFGADALPRDARFGDGTPIPADLLARVREVHAAHARAFDWRAGDVLVLDNMLVAHGRRPFEGPRRVLVSMGRMASAHAPAAAES